MKQEDQSQTRFIFAWGKNANIFNGKIILKTKTAFHYLLPNCKENTFKGVLEKNKYLNTLENLF